MKRLLLFVSVTIDGFEFSLNGGVTFWDMYNSPPKLEYCYENLQNNVFECFEMASGGSNSLERFYGNSTEEYLKVEIKDLKKNIGIPHIEVTFKDSTSNDGYEMLGRDKTDLAGVAEFLLDSTFMPGNHLIKAHVFRNNGEEVGEPVSYTVLVKCPENLTLSPFSTDLGDGGSTILSIDENIDNIVWEKYTSELDVWDPILGGNKNHVVYAPEQSHWVRCIYEFEGCPTLISEEVFIKSGPDYKLEFGSYHDSFENINVLETLESGESITMFNNVIRMVRLTLNDVPVTGWEWFKIGDGPESAENTTIENHRVTLLKRGFGTELSGESLFDPVNNREVPFYLNVTLDNSAYSMIVGKTLTYENLGYIYTLTFEANKDVIVNYYDGTSILAGKFSWEVGLSDLVMNCQDYEWSRPQIGAIKIPRIGSGKSYIFILEDGYSPYGGGSYDPIYCTDPYIKIY
jgi:hypothetical protein